MNDTVTSSLGEVDAIVLVIEASGWQRGDSDVLQLIPPASERVILAINKTDELTDRARLLPLMASSSERFPFRAIVPISAEKGRQLDDLLGEIRPLLPDGLPLFDADQYTDRSVRFLAAELIREKAYRLLGDELPYGVAVTIERWEEDDSGARIDATLVVDRESHKPIVIGREGAKLAEISRSARLDIAALLDKRVHLEVWVRVKRGWSDDARALKTLGYG
jgi:GTP-binding protein Era